MLLLHEFYNRKFLLPDKLNARERERMAASLPEAADGGAGDGQQGGTLHSVCLSLSVRAGTTSNAKPADIIG